MLFRPRRRARDADKPKNEARCLRWNAKIASRDDVLKNTPYCTAFFFLSSSYALLLRTLCDAHLLTALLRTRPDLLPQTNYVLYFFSSVRPSVRQTHARDTFGRNKNVHEWTERCSFRHDRKCNAPVQYLFTSLQSDRSGSVRNPNWRDRPTLRPFRRYTGAFRNFTFQTRKLTWSITKLDNLSIKAY